MSSPFLTSERLLYKVTFTGSGIVTILLILTLCSHCTTDPQKQESLYDSSPNFQKTSTVAESLEKEGLIDSSLALLQSLAAWADSIGTTEDQAYVSGLLGKHYLYKRGKINIAQEYLIAQRDILETRADRDVPGLIRNYLDLSFLHVKKLELLFARSYAMMAHHLVDNLVSEDSLLTSEVYKAMGYVWYNLQDSLSLRYYHLARQYLPSRIAQKELSNKILIGLINNFNNIPLTDSATYYLDAYFADNENDPALAEYEKLFGICHYITDEYGQSAFHLQKAVALFQNQRSPDPFSSVDAFLVLSAAYQYDRKFLPALANADSALLRKFGTVSDLSLFKSDISSVSLLTARGEVLADIGLYLIDTALVLRALEIYESVDTLRRYFTKLDNDTYLHQQFYDNFVYWKPIEIYAFMFNQTGAQKWLHRMHDMITAYKAQGFNRDKILNQLYDSPAKEKQSFQDFIQNDVALEEAIHADNAHQINMLLRQRQVIAEQVSQDIPDVMDQLIHPFNISSEDLLNYTTSAQVAVINYYIGNTYYNVDRIYVLIAVNGQFKLRVLSQSTDILRLNNDLYKLHEEAASSSSTLDTLLYYTTSYDLYQAMLKETMVQVDKVKDLIIIPDQRLHFLSFEGLVTNDPRKYTVTKDIVENAHYLIEDFKITYAFSPNDLIYRKPSARQEYALHLLAMAFSSKETLGSVQGSDSIQELNSSYRELQILEQLHDSRDAKYFYGYESTKQNFLKFASDAGIIHVSTHGAYDPEDRTSSVLYLRNNKGIEKLYPHEIRYGDIQPKLLVLSACDSGAGKASNEEGMFSIGRTFQAFGAEEVISALWPLSGNASAVFCEVFYTELFKGNSIENSVRHAKVQLFSNNERFALPGYWSTWILHK